jgi:hypothetical protein
MVPFPIQEAVVLLSKVKVCIKKTNTFLKKPIGGVTPLLPKKLILALSIAKKIEDIGSLDRVYHEFEEGRTLLLRYNGMYSLCFF